MGLHGDPHLCACEAFLEAQDGMVWRMADFTTPTESGNVEHACNKMMQFEIFEQRCVAVRLGLQLIERGLRATTVSDHFPTERTAQLLGVFACGT